MLVRVCHLPGPGVKVSGLSRTRTTDRSLVKVKGQQNSLGPHEKLRGTVRNFAVFAVPFQSSATGTHQMRSVPFRGTLRSGTAERNGTLA
jgi:hypothetical protein